MELVFRDHPLRAINFARFGVTARLKLAMIDFSAAVPPLGSRFEPSK
jgi:hypothetical protein